MFNKLFFLVFVWYFLSACTVLMPVHQVGSSQALKKGTLRWTGIIGAAPTVSSTDDNINNIVTRDDSHTGSHTGSYIGSYWAYGLTDAMDLEFETATSGLFGGGDKLSILGFKYQYLGLPEHSIYSKDQRWSAVIRSRIFFGFEKNCKAEFFETACNSEEPSEYTISRKNEGFSVAQILGYRISPLWSVYGGFQFLQANVKFIKNFEEEGTDSLEEKRKISLVGGILGMKVSTYNDKGVNYFISFETSPSLVNATYEKKKVFSNVRSLGMGISYQF